MQRYYAQQLKIFEYLYNFEEKNSPVQLNLFD